MVLVGPEAEDNLGIRYIAAVLREKGFRYFLLGAVIVFPIWFLMRVFKVFGGGDTSSAGLVPPERERHAAAPAKESPKPSPAGGQ